MIGLFAGSGYCSIGISLLSEQTFGLNQFGSIRDYQATSCLSALCMNSRNFRTAAFLI